MNTNEINDMLEKYKEGQYFKSTAFLAHTNLRKPDIDFEMTDDEKTEYAKCKADPVYFIEKYCFVRTGNGIEPVKLTEAQKALLLKDGDINVLQERSSGITSGLAFKSTHDMIFKNKNIGVVSNIGAYDELLGWVKEIYNGLPYYLQKGVSNFNMKEIRLEDNSGMTQVTANNFHGRKYDDIIMLNNCPASNATVEKIYANVMPAVRSTGGHMIKVDDMPKADIIFNKLKR